MIVRSDDSQKKTVPRQTLAIRKLRTFSNVFDAHNAIFLFIVLLERVTPFPEFCFFSTFDM